MLNAKKILALALTVTMLAMMLIGCGNSEAPDDVPGSTPGSGVQEGNNSGTNSETPKEGEEEAYVPAYPIVEEPITVKCVVVGQDMTNERILWQKLAELTNINVEFINVESEQLNVFLAGNEWPDFFLSGLNGTAMYDYGSLGHKLVDYNDYKDIMPNLWKIFEEYPVAKQVSTQIDGGIYGLPRIEESTTTSMARLHYRADFLEENNLEVPTTLDEFYDVLVKCRDLNGGKAPLIQQINETQYVTALLYPAFGNSPVPGLNDDGTGTVFDDRVEQQYRDYLSYINKLYEEGLLHEEFLTMDYNNILALVQEGSCIFFAECAPNVTADMFPDGEFHLGTMAPLVANKGDSPRCYTPNVVKNYTNFFSINADSPYIEEICKLVDIAFATEEVQEGTGLYGLAFFYGPVGMCIKLNDDNTYELTLPDGGDYSTDWYNKNMNYETQGITQLGQYVTSTPGNSQERQKGYMEKVLPYSTMPLFPTSYFTFTEEEQAVIDQYNTEYSTYVNEMRSKFIMGVEDINDDAVWAKYCAQMEAYGMNELVAVYQSAYERFTAN